MDIKDIIKMQYEFDKAHTSNFDWSQKIDENNLSTLEYLLISIMGEMGETSNLVKKVLRGDYSFEQKREEISEEVVDVFIYVIKLLYQLDIDIEDAYIKKLQMNKQRFERYENEENK